MMLCTGVPPIRRKVWSNAVDVGGFVEFSQVFLRDRASCTCRSLKFATDIGHTLLDMLQSVQHTMDADTTAVRRRWPAFLVGCFIAGLV